MVLKIYTDLINVRAHGHKINNIMNRHLTSVTHQPIYQGFPLHSALFCDIFNASLKELKPDP